MVSSRGGGGLGRSVVGREVSSRRGGVEGSGWGGQ